MKPARGRSGAHRHLIDKASVALIAVLTMAPLPLVPLMTTPGTRMAVPTAPTNAQVAGADAPTKVEPVRLAEAAPADRGTLTGATTLRRQTAGIGLAVPPPARAASPAGSLVRGSASALPIVLADAYASAVRRAPATCHLPVSLLAAIGEVESNSARGRTITADNRVVPGVYGLPLNGVGFASISDTERGVLDGDPVWDRAVGPMQFIPGTWRLYGTDGDGDGKADPQNVYDAAASAGRYLCAGGRDLATDAGLRSAILSYNFSQHYLMTVLGYKRAYETGGPWPTGVLPRTAAQLPTTVAVTYATPSPPASAGPSSQTATPSIELAAGQQTVTPIPTPSATPTASAMPTASATATASATPTAIATPSQTPAAQVTPKATATPDPTPSTPTTTPSVTATPSATPTCATPSPSAAPSAGATATPQACP